MNGPRAGLGGMSGAGLLVTGTVCAALLVALGTLCYMAANELAIPDELDTITTGLILAATSLLAKTWADRIGDTDAPAPVQVTNGPDDPVAVADAPEVPRSRRKRINVQRPVVVPDEPA